MGHNVRMIARIQQGFAFLLLTLLGACFWQFGNSFFDVLWVFIAVAGVYIAYLAILFVVVYAINRSDSQPRATLVALIQAWLREAIAAPKVFLWWQPFRTNAISDHLIPNPQRGVVFIHGFFCNRAFWSPWMRQLSLENRAFASVTLEPAFGSIDDYAAIVEAAVAKVTAATGLPPILICHSMGGLAARAWLRSNIVNSVPNDARIHRVITIGTPHFGTALSTKQTLLPFINTHQMQRLGAWTQQLAIDEAAQNPQRYAKFTCWYSDCDNIVAPTSTAMLLGADNRLASAQGHVSMAFEARVLQESLALLVVK